jgi:glycosyltransferase involved in cell wall biosynthesis
MTILLVADVPGWAWDRRARGIQKYAQVSVDVAYDASPAVMRGSRYDAILLMDWTQIRAKEHRNGWGMVASEGCMQEWPQVASDQLNARMASQSKNCRMAKARMPLFAGIITVNPEQRVREFLLTMIPRVRYQRTGVDTEIFHPLRQVRPDYERLRIGWCGKPSIGQRFSPKGFDEVLLPLQAKLGNIVDGVSIEWVLNTRYHTDRLTTEEMVEWYNSIDVLVVTSSAEGTPSVLLEAMSCGVPVISTAVGITSEVSQMEDEICQTRGLRIVPRYRTLAEAPSVVDALTTELEWVCRFPEMHRSMSRSARHVMTTAFSWEMLADHWIETLLSVPSL